LRGKSKEYWSCKYGCDLNKGICSHLDKLISVKPKTGVIQWTQNNEYLKAIKSIFDDLPTQSPEDFEILLKQYNLNPLETKLLVARFAYGKSYSTIAKEFSFNGRMAVHRYLKLLLGKLKHIVKDSCSTNSNEKQVNEYYQLEEKYESELRKK